jgi:Mg2+ and Co2+ transporter CorA
VVFEEIAFDMKSQEEAMKSLLFGMRKQAGSAYASTCEDTTEKKGKDGVRWVHLDAMDGLDHLPLLRLAVKYKLHALAIEDVIKNEPETKIDQYADNFFISLEVLALGKLDNEDPRKHRGPSPNHKEPPHQRKKKEPPRVQIHRSNVTMFVGGRLDTVITIHQDVLRQSSFLDMWTKSSDDDSNMQVNMRPQEKLWDDLRSEVTTDEPRRKVREERADFLVYRMLNSVVQNVEPIMKAYAERLMYFHGEPPRVLFEYLREVADVQLELRDVARSLRPLRLVVAHLIENDDMRLPASKMYLEDVKDKIETITDDVEMLVEMCQNLEASAERSRDKSINETLFGLSLITAIFLPMQFITGLYGMNFHYDEESSMPELGWKWGYAYFWALEAVVLVLGCIVMWIITGGHQVLSRCCRNCRRRCCCYAVRTHPSK